MNHVTETSAIADRTNTRAVLRAKSGVIISAIQARWGNDLATAADGLEIHRRELSDILAGRPVSPTFMAKAVVELSLDLDAAFEVFEQETPRGDLNITDINLIDSPRVAGSHLINFDVQYDGVEGSEEWSGWALWDDGFLKEGRAPGAEWMKRDSTMTFRYRYVGRYEVTGGSGDGRQRLAHLSRLS